MNDPLKLTALRPEQLIRLLKQAGCRTIGEESLAADFEAGAPRNADGTADGRQLSGGHRLLSGQP